MSIKIITINDEKDFNEKLTRKEFERFLFHYLEQYGDPIQDISKSIDYAFDKNEVKGGFLLAALLDNKLVGGLVINKTGMAGYIPENILVYVAVNNNYRGNGIGKKLVEKAIENSDGSVKLHVEYDNPAKQLYEKIGFTNKYAEMRYTK